MKLGYFTMPLHPPGRPWGETLREDREAILLADRLGYVEAFVGEHATDAAETPGRVTRKNRIFVNTCEANSTPSVSRIAAARYCASA